MRFQAKRDDCGDYTICAQNQYGKASISCAVDVMDKPGKPVSVGMGSKNRACRFKKSFKYTL